MYMDDDFFALRLTGGLTRDEAASLCGVTPRTIKHWENTQSPTYATNTVKMACGFPWSDSWEGWRFYGGFLWSPDGVQVSAGEIRALPYLHAQIREMRRSRKDEYLDEDISYNNVIPFPIQEKI